MPAVLPGKVGMLGKRSRADSILPADVDAVALKETLLKIINSAETQTD